MIKFSGLDIKISSESKAALSNAQNALDAKCIELMRPYVPVAMERFANRGKMRDAHKQESPGVIVNTEPKAQQEYYTNKGGSGGLRGKYWFERMVADHSTELEQAANEGLKK